MKILFIVARPLEINSSASLRNIHTINALAKKGFKVDIITSQYDKNHSNFSSVKLEGDVNIKYLPVNKIKKAASMARKNFLLNKIRIFLYKNFYTKEIYDNLKSLTSYVPKLNLMEKKYDLLISSSDPKSSHLLAYEILLQEKIQEVPWIQIWGDPFALDMTRKTKKPSNSILQEEKKLLEKAKKVIYVSHLTMIEQKKAFPEISEKMFFVPRPYEKERIFDNQKIVQDEKMKLVYCGDYNSHVRNLQPLYKTVLKTQDNMIVCGFSDRPLEETEDIQVFPRVPNKKVAEYEAESDVLVHISNLRGSQIPGKIYEYSSTNKPILFILDGNVEEIKKVFEKYNRYIFCENNETSIFEALMKIKTNKHLPPAVPVIEFSSDLVVKQILAGIKLDTFHELN